MRYCGIVPVGPHQVLCVLEEALVEEPPVRLPATFFEPGPAEAVAEAIRSFGDAVVAIAAPIRRPVEGEIRECDRELRRRGVFPLPFEESGRRMFQALAGYGIYSPDHPEGLTTAPVEEGAYSNYPVFETHPDGIFCALQGRRLPARRHPLGVQRRIEELVEDHIVDEGGELWYRRIEEIDAAAAALAAHRYAVGHACWVGDPDEAVIVLPGSRLPDAFSGEGVIPPVPRAPLPSAR